MDIRSLPWIEGAHSDGRTCTADGQWRRKRGVDPEIVERLEAKALAKLEPEPPVSAAPEPDETPLPADVNEFDKIRSGIKAAGNPQEIDDWWDYSREVTITASQRIALQSCAEERARAFR